MATTIPLSEERARTAVNGILYHETPGMPTGTPMPSGPVVQGQPVRPEPNLPKHFPDVIEFVTSKRFLGRERIYPRQGTLLKIIFLQDELFCADEQTEILTRRGWMAHDQVVEGEDVMTLTAEGVAEWAAAERVNVFPVQDEPVVRMEGVSHSSVTTPNHRWLVEKPDGTRGFVETRDLHHNHRIACGAPVANLPTDPKWQDAFVELAAWYWTEGHRIAGHGGVRITQSSKVNPAYVARIRACLTALFGPASDWLRIGDDRPRWREDRQDRDDMVAFRLNAVAAADLRWVAAGDEKVVLPEFLSSLTAAQVALFVDTSIDADGWTKPSSGSRAITQKSKARLDSLQMACSLAGIRTAMRRRVVGGTGRYAGVEQWELSLLERRSHFRPHVKPKGHGGRFSVTQERHTGFVWCPTTENGTWLARREGNVYFTGNTDYDHEVIAEWAQGYSLPPPEKRTPGDALRYDGYEGIPPDIYERIEINKAAGRRWFREVISVMGRRASKGFIGAVCGAYILYHYLQMWDPQGYFGIEADKRINATVFAGKRQQAKENQWRDIMLMLARAEAFARAQPNPRAESITLATGADQKRMNEMIERGMKRIPDLSSLEVVPRESTTMAGRGQASSMLYFDEMAHVIREIASADAGQVYESSTPSLDQFRGWEFIYAGSSPWQMNGKFYELWEQALEVDPQTLMPMRPEMLPVQLPSWAIYEDYERAHTIPRVPKEAIPEEVPGCEHVYEDQTRPLDCTCRSHHVQKSFDGERWVRKPYGFIWNPIQVYDDQMRRQERSNPETFKVEKRARWATSLDAYLNANNVRKMFSPWQDWEGRDRILNQKSKGLLSIDYVAHGDPSKSGASFGRAVAHLEGPDANGLYHVVFDQVGAWKPSDYERINELTGEIEHQIDYLAIEEDWKEIIRGFWPRFLTFDQAGWGSFMQHLQHYVRQNPPPKSVSIGEVTATAPLNWAMAETFKTALNLGLLHSPFDETAQAECLFLQDLGTKKVDHPTSGPVQTKDIFDCYHPDTEVLTARGWRKVSEVAEGEAVATRALDGTLEYQPVLKTVERWHSGVMHEFRGQRMAFSVTPTHNMLVHPDRTGGDPVLVPARSLKGAAWVPRTAMVEDRPDGWVDLDPVRDHIGRDRVGSTWLAAEDDYLRERYAAEPMEDLCAVLRRSRGSIYNRAKALELRRGQIGDRPGDRVGVLPKTRREDFARFLGIWLAEGSAGRGMGYAVRICQKKADGVTWIEEMFRRLGWPVMKRDLGDRGWTWTVKSRGLRDFILLCVDGDDRLIPDEVFATWSRTEMEALLEGLCVGDGTWSTRGGRFTNYSSSSRRLVDDVQRLMAHLGMVGNVRLANPPGSSVEVKGRTYERTRAMWSVSIEAPIAANGAKLDPRRVEQVDYDGPVHCLTVENHTLLVRLEGKPMWCGNCMANVVYRLIGDQMAVWIAKGLGQAPTAHSAAGVSRPSGSDTRNVTDPGAAFREFTASGGYGRVRPTR